MELPDIITHKNLEPILDAIAKEPCFQPGQQNAARPEWVDRIVTLEFPLGELAKDALTTLALVGSEKPEPKGLTGKEGFNAQGLEGKVQIEKPLFNAAMNLRLVLPVHRGRILTRPRAGRG